MARTPIALALTFALVFLSGARLPEPAAVPASRAGDARPLPDFEPALTALLRQVVTKDGLVHYDLLRGPLNGDFRRVLKSVEEFDPSRLRTDAEKLAFWMNAYNVQMLQNIVETPRVRDILAEGHADRFFKSPLRTARQAVSLDQIEHVILRRQNGPAPLRALAVARLDPRIHVGLNCAAVSCPRLPARAFTAADVSAQLDEGMRAFTAAERHFRVASGRVVLSSLVDWFGADFESAGAPAGDYLLRYMPATRPGYARLKETLQGRTAAQIKAAPGVTFEYLWRVNAAPGA